MLTRKELHRSFDSSFWRGLTVASFLFVVFAFAIHPAHAHGWHHRHHHHHHRVWHHWHRHHWHHHYRRHWHRHHTARALPRNAYRYEARVAAQSSDILATAERYLGDRNPTLFRRGPWCKAFVNMIARKTGHFYNRSLRAIDGLRMGVRVRFPRAGDLAVLRHHITIFAGYGGRGFLGLGGNQSGHRVTVSSYPIGRVVAWVRLR